MNKLWRKDLVQFASFFDGSLESFFEGREFFAESIDNQIAGTIDIEVLCVEDKVVVFGIGVVFVEVLGDKSPAFFGDFFDTLDGGRAFDVFEFYGSLDANMARSGDKNIEALGGWSDEIGSPAQNDRFALVGNGQSGIG